MSNQNTDMSNQNTDKNNQNAKYKYNMKELEDLALDAYAAWKADDSQANRLEFFNTVKDLAFAILKVGNFDKHDLDSEKVSYEYALYLFERVVFGNFVLEGLTNGRFPLNQYIRLNIKHVIHSIDKNQSWIEVISELEYSIGESPSLYDNTTFTKNEIEDKILNKVYPNLTKMLKIYFSFEEIKRLLPLSMDLFYSSSSYQNQFIISPNAPSDIKDFSIVLVSIVKKHCSDHSLIFSTGARSSDFKKAFNAALRSTVFLSSVVNSSFFPKELLLSLDIDSLYRITSILGGQTVRIPSTRELDTLIGAVITVSKIISEGKNLDEALEQGKEDYDLVLANHINIQSFISKMLQSYNIFKEDTPSQPIINMLLGSIKSLDTLFSHLQKKAKDAPADKLLKQYCELSSSFSQFTDSLVKVSSAMKDN